MVQFPRLSYGVYVDAYSWQKDTPKLLVECVPEYVGEEIVVKGLAGRHSIKEIKPYLRHESSMTDEEKENFHKLKVYNHNDCKDWYNSHHIGLIEKGLALEAPEGMYKTEQI